MEATAVVDAIKALIRPILILSGWGAWLYMILVGMTVPVALAGFIALITGEYIVERSIKRIKEN